MHKSDQNGDEIAANHGNTAGFTRPKIVTLKNDQIKELDEYSYKREAPKRDFKPDLSKLVPIDKIYKAYKNIRSTVRRTPLTLSLSLSEKYGANVYLKREDLQIVRSFKLRGAYNKFTTLTAEDKAKGVVCASAGNHAQGVAYSCNAMKVKGVIFMPVNAPSIKLRSVKSWGGSFIEVR